MSDQTPAPASGPRPDAAAPGWYPHPRRPGALRYWNGTDWVEADATRGWYPDPADRSLLRLWTGQAWGEVLTTDPWAPGPRPVAPAPPVPAVPLVPAAPVAAPTPAPAPIPAVAPNPRLADAAAVPSRAWVTSVLAVACLVAGLVVGGVVVSTVGGDDAPAVTRTVTATPSDPDPAGGKGGTDGDAAAGAAGDLVVTRVLSSRTLELTGPDGRLQVRLLGLGPTPCDTNAPGKALLKDEVAGQDAVVSLLTDPVSGDVGAYVDVAGRDVGEGLIRAGLASAAVGHPRAPAYAKAQAAATAYCPAAPPGSPSGSPSGSATPAP